MHGVKKVKTDAEKEQERLAKSLRKISEARVLLDAAMSAHQRRVYSDEALETCAAALTAVPECYALWNYRRMAIDELCPPPQQLPAERVAKELGLLEKCIASNTKSYWLWNHRKWVGKRAGDAMDWPREIKLCDKLLSLDGRNFHCWNYRRGLIERVKGMGEAALADELEYTKKLIEQNFSNYSAWHQRSYLLPLAYSSAGPSEYLQKLREEFDYVRTAVYIEPNDQSAWIYHRWLVGTIQKQMEALGMQPSAQDEFIATELEEMKKLLDIEPDCKWVVLACVWLMRRFKQHDASAEVAQHVEKLCSLDPIRSGYYRQLGGVVEA
eukprot:m51a1_g3979 putative protein geranylgeranyltransferase type ii (325) ;mRNA; f:440411-441715